MGVLNALSMMEAGMSGGLTQEELLMMARSNAQRLQRTLITLLDLASLESGTFHARLREVELVRLLRSRIESHAREIKDKGLRLSEQFPAEAVVLADPQKFGRAIDLCLEVILSRVVRDSELEIRISSSGVALLFSLRQDAYDAWEQLWSQSVAGFEGGVASPVSAFAGVVQSEQAFLSRTEEGLGAELLLVHQILRAHHGRFTASHEAGRVKLSLVLPQLSSEDGLSAVLRSRAYEVSTELASVALVLMDVPSAMDLEGFQTKIRAHLFRTTDAAYALPRRNQLALVLDDCKAEDIPGLMGRLEKSLGQKLSYAAAHCPSDGLDPGELVQIASKRLKKQ